MRLGRDMGILNCGAVVEDADGGVREGAGAAGGDVGCAGSKGGGVYQGDGGEVGC